MDRGDDRCRVCGHKALSCPQHHCSARHRATLDPGTKSAHAPRRPWPYDQGTRKNFEEVFGWQKRYWLLPLRPDAERAALRRAYLDWTLPCPTYANA